MYACIYVYAVCVYVLSTEAKESIVSLGIRVIGGCEPPWSAGN